MADIAFSLPGLTSDLQDGTKQQQRTLLDDALGWVGCPAHPKAPFMLGCEPRGTPSCGFGVSWDNSCSRKWAFHADGKLHPSAAAVSQGQVCFPAQALSPWMGNDLHQTGSNQSPSATHAKPGDFTDLLQRRTSMNGPAWRWVLPSPIKTHPINNNHFRFYRVNE